MSGAATLLAATVMLAGSALSSAAQSAPAGIASLVGTVRDSATGLPVHRTSVCVTVRLSRSSAISRCAPTDSAGAYRIDSVPPPRHLASVYCETVRHLGDENLASDSLAFEPGGVSRRDWMVSRTGCDQRPLRRVTGVFRGHYIPGFESSDFVPCPADGWFTRGDSLDWVPRDSRRAWAVLSPGTMQRLRWPRAPRDEHGYARYFVRWRGTVIGPGRYGHMGVAPFEIRVDSVMELRAPTRRDCR